MCETAGIAQCRKKLLWGSMQYHFTFWFGMKEERSFFLTSVNDRYRRKWKVFLNSLVFLQVCMMKRFYISFDYQTENCFFIIFRAIWCSFMFLGHVLKGYVFVQYSGWQHCRHTASHDFLPTLPQIAQKCSPSRRELMKILIAL